jgi:hypothetical protein
MSYPLAQFSSDTLITLRDVSNKSHLKLNLVQLMLTALADVTLCCDVKSIHELYNHYKVLYKCLDVYRDSSVVIGKKVLAQLTVGLLRPFRITLQRYVGSKV